jgi:dolichol-phosphate mannosyltransferase
VIKETTGLRVAIMMADQSDDINDLITYNKLMVEKNYDAILGSRFIKDSKVSDYPLQKLILNRVFNFFVSLIFWNKYNDYTNAFKIYKKSTLLEILPLISESFNIFLEIPLKIISRNYNYKIIPINWSGRKKGSAKFKIKELKSKYLFTLIYCFIEKNLLNKKK